MKVLVLEDDKSLREVIRDELERMGFRVYSFKNGDDAMDSLMSTTYDLMMLDINVPGIDGYQFLEMIRKSGNETPAIIISSYTDIDHFTKGYELGCNDYLRKPFSLKELELRVKELLKTRKYQTRDSKIELDDGYVFDTENHTLQKADKIVDLVPKERLLVELLVQNRGKAVSVESILDYVWDDETNANNLRVLIYKLRKKLGEKLIRNMKGVGYKIN